MIQEIARLSYGRLQFWPLPGERSSHYREDNVFTTPRLTLIVFLIIRIFNAAVALEEGLQCSKVAAVTLSRARQPDHRPAIEIYISMYIVHIIAVSLLVGSIRFLVR